MGAGRTCKIVDAGIRKPLDVRIHVPVENMREPDAHDVTDPAVGGGYPRRVAVTWWATAWAAALPASPRSIWPAIYPELRRLVREHGSTIIFVNSRRGAERLAVRLNELAAEEDGEDGTNIAPGPPRLAGT